MRPFLAAATGVALALAPAVASAQEQEPALSRWVFRAELGAGTMISDFVDVPDDTSLSGELTVRIAYRLFEPLSLQLGAGAGRLFQPANRDDVAMIFGFGGVRLEPKLGSAARLWIDGNAGVHAIGSLNRFGVDGGLGIEFFLSRTIALGPFGRFFHTFDGRDASPSRVTTVGGHMGTGDTNFWVAGVSLAVYSLMDAPARPARTPRATAARASW